MCDTKVVDRGQWHLTLKPKTSALLVHRFENQKFSKSRLTDRLEPHNAEFRLAAFAKRDRMSQSTIRGELAAAWGDPDQQREVAWTLFLRVGMITGTKP
jgi:hypothetical protein